MTVATICRHLAFAGESMGIALLGAGTSERETETETRSKKEGGRGGARFIRYRVIMRREPGKDSRPVWGIDDWLLERERKRQDII
jgi:hypothetical protein